MKIRIPTSIRLLFLLSFCLVVTASNFSCSSRATDPRAVIPADALVYLETNDLGNTVAAITESESFARVSAKKPDLSAINGVRFAVAVMGFQSSEQEVGEDQAVGKITPQFVAVAETNAWSWQAASFAENKLGEFINEVYGGGLELNVTPKNDGKYFVWTAQDGRKVYALVQGSVIYFGNDESAIEKCQSVKRGETESIAKNPKITSGDRLGFGYVSPDGVAQIANIAGISLAMDASEDGEVKSFVARVLPEILRNSAKELTWTTTKSEGGIEDKYDITLNPEVTRVFGETMLPGDLKTIDLTRFVPAEFASATLYDLKDPLLAWRGLVLTAQSQTDEVSGKLIAVFSGSLFEPYAIEDAEMFLGSVEGKILTVKADADGENAAVIAKVRSAEAKKAAAKEINFAKQPERFYDVDVWKSDDGDLGAAFVGDIVIFGDAETVLKCVAAGRNTADQVPQFEEFAGPSSVSMTISIDAETPAKVAEVLGEKKATTNQRIFSTTNFDRKGMRRTTRSDYGLLGSILEQLRPD